MVVRFSEIKRCQNPQFTQIVQKAKKPRQLGPPLAGPCREDGRERLWEASRGPLRLCLFLHVAEARGGRLRRARTVCTASHLQQMWISALHHLSRRSLNLKSCLCCCAVRLYLEQITACSLPHVRVDLLRKPLPSEVVVPHGKSSILQRLRLCL